MAAVDFNPMRMDSMRVLVTGASSGIGREVSKTISQLGGRVTLVARDQARLEQTHQSLQGDGHQIERFDLTDVGSISSWIKGLSDDFGPFDGIVHCAGIQDTHPVRLTDVSTFEAMMQINSTSAFALAKGFRQKGVFSPKGNIILLSSVAAIRGNPGVVPYSTSKAALLGMTRSLAAEFARDGIRVNSIIAGHVESKMAKEANRLRTTDQIEELERQHLLGIGLPEDVAYGVVFLLSNTGKWITGSSLVIDGGYSVR